MTYFIALIIFLLPSYLIRFSIFNIPTTLLEVLIYAAFIWTIVQQILNSKLETLNKSKIPNSKQSIIPNSLFTIPIILFILSGIISVVIAPDKREALGLFKAYIFDPILFFYVVVINFYRKKETLNPKSDHSTGSGRPEESRTGETLNKFQISNPKSQTSVVETYGFTTGQVNSKFQIQNSKQSIIHNSSFIILLRALVASGVIVAIHAIWQKITGDTTVDGRVLGIFSLDPNASPNYLAFYLAPITVLEISYWLLIINRKNFITQLLNCLITLLLFFALWFSGSRAAVGAVIVGVMSYLVISYWQQIKSNRIIVILLYCLIVLMIAVGWQITKPDWNLSNTEGGRITSSNNIRWEIWNTTVKDIIPHNLIWLKGVGLGNYQNHFTDLTQDKVNFPEWISPLAVTPHNIFLNIWVNLGLLGLISFVWLLTLFFKFVIRSIRYSRGSELLFATIITILTQGLVDSPIWKNDLVIMFWLFLAIAWTINSNVDKKK